MPNIKKLSFTDKKMKLVLEAEQQRASIKKSIITIKEDSLTLVSVKFITTSLFKKGLSILSPTHKKHVLVAQPIYNYVLDLLSKRNKYVRIAVLTWMNYTYYKKIKVYLKLIKKSAKEVFKHF